MMNKISWDKYWYLGFLGLVGIYQWPHIMAYFQGNASAWTLTDLLWFLWFLHFCPKRKPKSERS